MIRVTRTTFDDNGWPFRWWKWRIEWRGRVRFVNEPIHWPEWIGWPR